MIHMSGLASQLLYMCTWLIICLEMGFCFSGKEKAKNFFDYLNSDMLYALNSLWTVRSFGKSYMLFMIIFLSLSLIVLGGSLLVNDE